MMLAVLFLAIGILMMAPAIFAVVGMVFDKVFGLVTDAKTNRVVMDILVALAFATSDVLGFFGVHDVSKGWKIAVFVFFIALAFGAARYGGKGSDGGDED